MPKLRRMSGAEDGTTDALFRFSQPVTGCYLWCPDVSTSLTSYAPVARLGM